MLRVDAISDFIALIGFTAAVFYFIKWRAGVVPRDSSALLTLACGMLLMVFVSLSNVLEHAGITAYYDAYEDYAEVLMLPLIGYGLYLLFTERQFDALRSAQRAAKASQDMLLGVMDSSPIGIAVVDSNGDVNYSNSYADSLLGLTDQGFGAQLGATKVVPAGTSPFGVSHTFGSSLIGRPVESELWECVGPDGHRVQVRLSARPYHTTAGEPNASVVVFAALD